MKKGFNLYMVIIIVLVTSIVSAVTTGVILNNNYKSQSGLTYTEVMNDDELSDFLNVYSTIVSNYYDDVDTTGMINSAIDAMKGYEGSSKEELLSIATTAMLNFLGDEYTTFLTEGDTSNLYDSLDATFKGIGVSIEGSTIISVTNDSPASKAGLLPGDIFTKIDNTEINDTNYSLIPELIKNNDSEIVNLSVKRGDEILSFEITKDIIDASTIYKVIEDSSVGYIDVDVFSSTVGESFEKSFNSLKEQNITGLIIDLRNNTGGYLNGATDIASLILEKNEIIYSLENKDDKDIYKDNTEVSSDIPIVILVNEESASASEILAAALKDNGKATIVGKTTYGKGKVQQTIQYSDNTLAKYTSAKWYTPNGLCIDGIGLTPDYDIDLEMIYDNEDQIIGIVDTQLNKAVELLKGA